ncbi:Arc family DNA-binding protein [Sphingomonas baiyangensis]
MRERLANAAELSGRSMNAEAVARLEASFEGDEAERDRDERIAALEREVADLHKAIERLTDRVDWVDGAAMRQQARD